jgi:hypothetical protein
MKSPVPENLQNEGLTRGSVIRSLSGHDRHQIFLVMRVNEGYAWLADGANRRHERPKKKKVRHVRMLGQLAEPGMLDQIDTLGDAGQRNAALRKLLNNYLSTNLTKEET